MPLGQVLFAAHSFVSGGGWTFWLKWLFPGPSVTNLGLGLLFSCFTMERAVDAAMDAKRDARGEVAPQNFIDVDSSPEGTVCVGPRRPAAASRGLPDSDAACVKN